MKLIKILCAFVPLGLAVNCFADSTTNLPPQTATNAVSYAPAVLPGNGLAQHPFLYTGEWDHRNTNQTIFLVRDGKVVWTYSIPIKDPDGTLQELGDATMLSNGNIVFCRKIGASEVTPDKKIIWNIDAPKGTEIHSVQPIGLDHVLVTINGNPAKLLLINTTTGETEQGIHVPRIESGSKARTSNSAACMRRRMARFSRRI